MDNIRFNDLYEIRKKCILHDFHVKYAYTNVKSYSFFAHIFNLFIKFHLSSFYVYYGIFDTIFLTPILFWFYCLERTTRSRFQPEFGHLWEVIVSES